MFGMQRSQTEMKDVLTDEQQFLLNQIVGTLWGQVGRGVEAYGGQMVPGASQLQQQAFQRLGTAFSGAPGDALTRMLSAQPAYEVDPEARQRAYEAVEAQTMAQLQKQLPALEQRYNVMGAGRSGGLQHALASAAGDVSLGLGALRGQYEYQDEMARRAAAEAAAGRQGMGIGLWGNLAGQQLQAGQIQRGIMGEQLAEGYNKWLYSQPYANPWMTQFAPLALGTQVQVPTQESYGFSILGG